MADDDLKLPAVWMPEEIPEWTEAELRWLKRKHWDYGYIYRSAGQKAAMAAHRADWMMKMADVYGFVPAPGEKRGVPALMVKLLERWIWNEIQARYHLGRRDYEWAFEFLGGREGLLEVVGDGVRLLVRAVDETDAVRRVREAGLAAKSVAGQRVTPRSSRR